MASGSGIYMTAGAIAFAGNFKESGGFPENGYTIVASTIALVILASFASNTPFQKPVAALAWLTLLGSAFRYIPALAERN